MAFHSQASKPPSIKKIVNTINLDVPAIKLEIRIRQEDLPRPTRNFRLFLNAKLGPFIQTIFLSAREILK